MELQECRIHEHDQTCRGDGDVVITGRQEIGGPRRELLQADRGGC